MIDMQPKKPMTDQEKRNLLRQVNSSAPSSPSLQSDVNNTEPIEKSPVLSSEEDSNGFSKYNHPKRLWACAYQYRQTLALVGFISILFLFMQGRTPITAGKPGSTLRLATWNMAAINNNPFEYWITYDENPKYVKLMEDVENFIENTGEADIPVSEVFTSEMFAALKEKMEKQGWEGLDVVTRMWEEDYSKRKIVSEFLKDRDIGSKRLASMLDRITNTLNLADGSQIYRPTAINMYEGSQLDSMQEWFDQWSKFLFDTPVTIKSEEQLICELLAPIKKAKYPAVTEEEERVSIPLQTVVGGAFDAILVHMLNTVAPGEWMDIKMQLGSKLNKGKIPRSLDILENTYSDRDIMFLQEVSAAFVGVFQGHGLSKTYDLHVPAKVDGKRDQNSMVLTRKSLEFVSIKEITDDIIPKEAKKEIGCADGDLFAVHGTINGVNYVLASFHGDTNGLQTIPITKKMNSAMTSDYAGYRLIFGMDANVYEKESKKTQSFTGFVDAYKQMMLQSCFGDKTDPSSFTTYNARTYLQAQIQKACKSSEKRECGDVNPKDFILFFPGHFSPVSTTKDNTGKKSYINDMVFPTLDFPSDHAILSAEITVLA